jgi:hypothetical protein
VWSAIAYCGALTESRSLSVVPAAATDALNLLALYKLSPWLRAQQVTMRRTDPQGRANRTEQIPWGAIWQRPGIVPTGVLLDDPNRNVRVALMVMVLRRSHSHSSSHGYLSSGLPRAGYQKCIVHVFATPSHAQCMAALADDPITKSQACADMRALTISSSTVCSKLALHTVASPDAVSAPPCKPKLTSGPCRGRLPSLRMCPVNSTHFHHAHKSTKFAATLGQLTHGWNSTTGAMKVAWLQR